MLLECLHRPSRPQASVNALPDCEEAVWATLQDMPPFRFPDSNGEISVALVGEDPLRLRFFQHIFAMCQYHTGENWTPLHFHIISTDPVAFLEQLEALLPRVLPRIYVESHLANDQVHIQMLKRLKALQGQTAKESADAFACVHLLHPADKLKNQWLKIRSGTGDTPLANYILLLNPRPNENEYVCKALLKVFSDNTPCFIGIGGDRLPETASPALRLRNIPLDGSCQEDSALAALEKRALQVHTYYEKEYDQRKSSAAILESFGDSNSYNHRSSRRAALSISAKLHRCGLEETPESARQILKLLEVRSEEDWRTLQSLLLMEHRSWQCFMLTEGWRLPTAEELKDPVRGAYTFSNPSHKLKLEGIGCHPCLVDSELPAVPAQFPLQAAQVLPLQNWTPEHWDNPNKPTDKLDPLDRMSVQLHRLLNTRLREEFPATLAHYREQLTQTLEGTAALKPFQKLFALGDRILAGEDNNDWQWNRLYAQLPADAMQLPAVSAYITELRNAIRCAMERNAYRDFKKTDLDLLLALPDILDPSEPPVIYKLSSGVDWENVVCSVMIEPRKLVLLHSGKEQVEADANKKQYTDLFSARNCDTTVHLLNTATNIAPPDNALLDVTGADPATLLWALKHPALRNLPRIYYAGGTLCTDDPDRFDPRRYTHRRRWLTVRETLLLSGNQLQENADAHILLEMQEEYKDYFDILRDCRPDILADLAVDLRPFGNKDSVSYYDKTGEHKQVLTRMEGEMITDLTIEDNNISFRFASNEARACLLKEGNVLEALVYHKLLSSGLFDDVRISVKVGWFADRVRGADTTNEIDVVCTRGLRTYFISCKKTSHLTQEYYPEVWYEAHHFGVDAVPLLVWASNSANRDQVHINRGKRMNVQTIHLDTSRSAESCCAELLNQIKSVLSRI